MRHSNDIINYTVLYRDRFISITLTHTHTLYIAPYGSNLDHIDLINVLMFARKIDNVVFDNLFPTSFEPAHCIDTPPRQPFSCFQRSYFKHSMSQLCEWKNITQREMDSVISKLVLYFFFFWIRWSVGMAWTRTRTCPSNSTVVLLFLFSCNFIICSMALNISSAAIVSCMRNKN